MIKLFRKIRQRLLTENKFSKYLLYAVGEIVLVVIGILIALSINNWNENQKRTKQENHILISLSTELNSQIVILEKTIKNDTIRYLAADTLMMISGPTNFKLINATSFKRLLFKVGDRTSYNPQFGTVNALLNSGELALIKNDTLKIQIAGLIGRLEDYMEEDITIENFVENELNPYLRKKVPLYDQKKASGYRDFRKGNYLIASDQISILLSDLYFNNLLGYARFRYRVRTHEGKDLLNYYNKLSKMIEIEISKH